MRLHVLGLGPVGQLVAFHLRRNLSPRHAITLMFKTPSLATRLHESPLHIEYQGVVSSTSNFETESTVSSVLKLKQERRSVREAEQSNVVSMGQDRHVLPSHELRKAIELQKDKRKPDADHIDSLIVACKAQSTLYAIRQVAHRLSPESTIVLLQNGNLSVHEQLLQTIFAKEDERPHFVLVSNTHGAFLKQAPFHVVHAGVGRLRFGIVPDGRRDYEKGLKREYSKRRLDINDIANPHNDPEQERYRSLRNTIAWDSFSNIQVILRQKLVVNCVINPLTTLIGCRNGDLYDNPAAQRLASRICREAADIFKKEAIASAGPGVDPKQVYIPPELNAENLMNESQRVAKVTAENISSMLADVKKGNRMTEIDFLNGHLLALGGRYDSALPVNASMVDLVKLRTQVPLDMMM
ncbi:ketopantoate reductase PanE/ApbA C terminal-domain-containing protein [Phellopilus nigrolimitatus]|nr:ketopantoate reductase PanE/ApbA C terminal-domain-containing protein [Phellopilus nigrolimitatus]